MAKMIRPAATEEDKAIFDRLLQKISAVDSYFCCGGTLELTDRPLTLYYKSETTGKRNWLDFHKLFEQSAEDRQTAINDLLEVCVPAPHGRGNETVLDESYRLARELRQNEFALSIELLSEAGAEILTTISSLTAGRSVLAEGQASKTIQNLTMIPRLYKLNAYAKNGFFKSHRDTPKGNDHVGTLMIGLPTSYTGGALRVNHDGNEIMFDWHQQCSEGFKAQENDKLKLSLPWAFLFSDVEHEVLPVESGARITIVYDIFSSPKRTQELADMGSLLTNMDGTTIPLYNDFVAALRNPSFLIQGAEVAIALSHSYPSPRTGVKLTDTQFAESLKGVDAVVYCAMKAAGFDVSLKVVMREEGYYTESMLEGIPQDGYDPLTYDEYSDLFLVTSDTFTYPEETMETGEDGGMYEEALEAEFGVRASPQLMWVKKPKDTFINAGSYIAYANEYSVEYLYSAAAFVLNVPPFGEKSRAF